jgi:thiol-disulfide isomerase/thioredoxin
MNISRHLSLCSCAALLLGLAACTPKKEAEPPKPKTVAIAGALPKLGEAPAWKLQDLNGQTVSGDQLRGKVVVLDFWATWCPPCRMEIPGYIEMAKKYEKDGLVIVGVSLDEGGPEVVKPFATKMGMSYTVVMGNEVVQSVFGGMDAIPTTFIIDRSGQIRDRKVGAEESAEYEKKVLSVLKEKV